MDRHPIRTTMMAVSGVILLLPGIGATALIAWAVSSVGKIDAGSLIPPWALYVLISWGSFLCSGGHFADFIVAVGRVLHILRRNTGLNRQA